MIQLLRLSDGAWPRTLADLQAAYPLTGFPADLSAMSPADLAEFDHCIPVPTPAPTPSATERVEEVHPVLVDSEWRQAWQLVDVPPPPQPPDVLGFFSELSRNPAIATPIGDLLSEMMQPRPNPAHAPQAALGLGVGLGQVADRGDPRVFLDAWHQALDRGLLGPELIAGVQQLAQSHNLPAEFVAALQPAPPPEPTQ